MKYSEKYTKIRLILGDQLNQNHSWFQQVSDETLYVMMEVRSETDYAKHHIQKVAAFFMSMRNFYQNLSLMGHHFHYIKIDDPANLQSITNNLEHLIKQYNISYFEYQQPDEYRLEVQLINWTKQHAIQSKCVSTEHFFSTKEEFAEIFGSKNYLMESFYRKMRKKHQILMEDSQPIGGQWNFDKENRNKYDRKIPIPTFETCTEPELDEIVTTIQKLGISTIGQVDAQHFIWPCSRKASLKVLDHFVHHLLPYFGKYQDALYSEDDFLFHSRLSFALNTKMISPKEVIDKAVNTWRSNQELISLSSIEGFVRQILGWREFMRGVYWNQMPDYKSLNFFNHQNKLPKWFWNGNTKMKCLSHAIQQSLKWAYAHHIQRLMVTGNFALLAGIHPDEVDEWYLGIYIDAIEWVEITNTRGMSQFADGGIIATKPYVSSANYIHKMSNYCNSCFYQYQKKYGDKACPFNSLYWNFYHVHESKLIKNPRINHTYPMWHRMDNEEKAKILEQARIYLETIDTL